MSAMTYLALRNLALLLMFAGAVVFELVHHRQYPYRIRRWWRRRQRAKARALDPRTDAEILLSAFRRKR